MELLLAFAFQVLTFDTFVAGCTNATVKFVIVAFAIWRVIHHVESCCLERFRACLADEALLMVSSSEATIRGRYRLSFDCLAAPFAISLRSTWATAGIWTVGCRGSIGSRWALKRRLLTFASKWRE